MIRTAVPISCLRPPQEEVEVEGVNYFIRKLASGVDVGFAPVVPISEGVHDRDLLIGDAHHRLYARYALGELIVPVAIHETDDEIRQSKDGCLSMWDTLAEVRDTYTPWVEFLKNRRGIACVADIAVVGHGPLATNPRF